MKKVRTTTISDGVSRAFGRAVGLGTAILLGLALPVQAASALHEFVILVDTSESMLQKRKLENFKLEMIKLVESSIPIDGTWRIRIFSFDRGLNSKAFSRELRTAQDQHDAELFFNVLEARGAATWLFQALNGVLTQVESTPGESQDIVIHVFTDGDSNGGGSSFAENLARFSRLRGSRSASTELFYHALEGYSPPGTIRSLIDPGKGVFLMEGVKIPPKVKIKPLAFQPSTSTPVQFVATRLGTVERWTWDLGDGTTKRDETPTHLYEKPGEYWVNCVAANSAGAGSNQIKITVTGKAPVADFDAEEPAGEGGPAPAGAVPTSGIPIQFRDRSKGEATAWTWDYGDKSPRSAEGNPVHWYPLPGIYEVSLTAKNEYGENTVTKKIQVNPRPTLRFSWTPEKPRYGTTVQFVNESVGDLKWSWDFGNGQTSAEKNPKTAYAKPGLYTVRLTGEDARGQKLTTSAKLEVLGDDPPKASFVLNRTNLIVGEEVLCTDTSTGLITQREWNLGDGTRLTNAKPAHLYVLAGNFSLTLTAVGPGGRDTSSAAVQVQPATVRFELAPDKVVEGEPIRLLNRSVGPFKSWRWEISDGTVYTNQEPTHVFKKAGPYSLKLTGAFAGSTGSGSTASRLPEPLSATLSVVVGSTYTKPKMAFALRSDGELVRNGQLLKRAAPVSVKLTNLSTGSIQSWVWDFGDGTTNNMVSPTNHYEKQGRYRVSLTLRSTRGEVVESAGDDYIWLDVLPPPILPGWARWPAAALFYVMGYLAVRFWPRQRRHIRYQDGVKPAMTFRSWKANPHFLAGANGWTEATKKPRPAPQVPDKGVAPASAEFRASLTRNAWLRKQYRFMPVRGDTKPFGPSNRPLIHQILVNHSYVKCGENRLLFQTLNDKALTGLVPQAGLAAGVWLFLSLTWHLFG